MLLAALLLGAGGIGGLAGMAIGVAVATSAARRAYGALCDNARYRFTTARAALILMCSGCVLLLIKLVPA